MKLSLGMPMDVGRNPQPFEMGSHNEEDEEISEVRLVGQRHEKTAANTAESPQEKMLREFKQYTTQTVAAINELHESAQAHANLNLLTPEYAQTTIEGIRRYRDYLEELQQLTQTMPRSSELHKRKLAIYTGIVTAERAIEMIEDAV